MNHKLITMNKFVETATALKSDLLNLDRDVSLDEFKQTFHKFGLVVDDGQYDLFNMYHKISMFPVFAEGMVVNTVTISDGHYNDLNTPPELLSFQPITDGSSSAVLKEDILKRLEVYQADFKDIKKIPKDSVMGKMKDNMFVEAYESVQKDLSKLFNKHGVTTNYEANKGIIKAAKQIDKFPIATSVSVNNLVSRRIQDGLLLEAQVAKNNIKPSEPSNKKGIFIA